MNRDSLEKKTLLRVENLTVDYQTERGPLHAVRGVSFALREGETLAVVGESGCGKTALCRSILGILPKNGRIVNGGVFLGNRELSSQTEKELLAIRGKELSMIFQDPMTALDPVIPVGRQIEEAILIHEKSDRQTVRNRAVELMRMVGIEEPEERSRWFPHQFSGGMRQRIVIAVALSCKPRVLIADEPTTALDVTIQAQILELLKELQEKTGIAILFITHDLGVVANIAHRIGVMYAGKLVEIGTVDEVFSDPAHPYTWGLMGSLPDAASEGEYLDCIPGMPPDLTCLPQGDPFAERNPYAQKIDFQEEPPLFKISETHYAATWMLSPGADRPVPPVRAVKGRLVKSRI